MVYRGCMMTIFGGVVLLFAVILAIPLGVIGFLLPWLMLGFAYQFIRSILGEVAAIGDDLDTWS